MNTNWTRPQYRMGQNMKVSPISSPPSVAVAVVADEENVIATKTDFDDAPREDEETAEASSSSRSRWTICLIASVIALVAVVAVVVALPLVHTRETDEAAMQITFGMNPNDNNETTRIIKTITSNGQHGICTIGEHGASITYTPNQGFFGIDTCTYAVIVCSDNDFCSDPIEETITVMVEDPDAPATSPDAMVLVSKDRTEPTATSTTRSVISTVSTTSSTTPAPPTTTTPDEEGGVTTIIVPTTTSATTAGALSTSSSTTSAPSTTSFTTITTTVLAEASQGNIQSLIGTKWKALQLRWLLGSSSSSSSSGELKEATENDRSGPITLRFDSDTAVSGTCGNNRCSNRVSFGDDYRLGFDIFRRTRMIASEQEANYVFLLQKNDFFYEVREDVSGLLELHFYEIVIEDGVEKRGERLMASYVQLSDDDEEV